MLALPSWSMGEVDAAEFELEADSKQTDKEAGKLKSADREFTCREQKEGETPKLKETKERLSEKPKESTKAAPKSTKQVIQKAVILSQSPKLLQQKAQKSVARSLPRHLPSSSPSSKALPRPFQMTASKQPKANSPLVRKEAERTKSREQQASNQKANIAGQAHQNVEVRVRDSLDQDEEKKRSWSWEKEDDLRGVAKVQAQTYNATREYAYKAMSASPDKPFLVRPRMGIYALYYILSKLGLISDSRSHFDTKQQIQINQEETELTHKERLEEMKKAIDEEKSSKRWSVATQVFSWFTSFMGIITGIALMMTGVGVVAGALLVCAGLIMVTNQLMQLTGAWTKIIEKLPGTPEEKRSTMIWIQIALTVLCFLLSGAGIVFGGYTQVTQAMTVSQQVTMGGVILMGYSTASFGEGVSHYRHRNRLAEVHKHKIRLERLKHRREDLQAIIEASMERMERLFEDLARLLEFESELFRADQRVLR